MRRSDISVFSISAVLGAVVVAAVAYSLLVLDRDSSAVVSQNTDSSWLVVTWGPSFCTVDPSNRVCTSGGVDELGQTLILHGLWPQPPENQYCGMPQMVADKARQGQGDFPPLELSDGVRTSLQSTMAGPDTIAPHEWYAHGTCSGVTPDDYFGDAVSLTAQVRDVLDPVFRDAEGGQITLRSVRDRIESQFGAGTGDRVDFSCRKVTGEGTFVVEVRMSLPPVAALRATDRSLSLGRLLHAAPPIAADCRHGRVADASVLSERN